MSEDGHNKDGRALRQDLRHRHDGKVSPSLSGPVISLDPLTMRPRRNITAETDAAKIEAAASLSWEQQADEQEKLVSILLAKLSCDIRLGAADDNTINRLAKLTSITKQFLTEKRQAQDDDEGDESLEELRARAASLLNKG